MFNSQYINYPSAVLLKKIGFNHVADYSIVQYTEDFVYDDDPEHPESHKAGDIRVYRLNWVPNKQSNAYPLISITDAMYWLRKEYGINIFARLVKGENGECKWNAYIEQYIKHTDSNNISYESDNTILKQYSDFNNDDDCLEYAVYKALKYIDTNCWD